MKKVKNGEEGTYGAVPSPTKDPSFPDVAPDSSAPGARPHKLRLLKDGPEDQLPDLAVRQRLHELPAFLPNQGSGRRSGGLSRLLRRHDADIVAGNAGFLPRGSGGTNDAHLLLHLAVSDGEIYHFFTRVNHTGTILERGVDAHRSPLVVAHPDVDSDDGVQHCLGERRGWHQR